MNSLLKVGAAVVALEVAAFGCKSASQPANGELLTDSSGRGGSAPAQVVNGSEWWADLKVTQCVGPDGKIRSSPGVTVFEYLPFPDSTPASCAARLGVPNPEEVNDWQNLLELRTVSATLLCGKCWPPSEAFKRDADREIAYALGNGPETLWTRLCAKLEVDPTSIGLTELLMRARAGIDQNLNAHRS